MYGSKIQAAALILASMACGRNWAIAQTVSAPAPTSTTPVLGNLQMPPVSPQQADQFFAARAVPPSNLPAPSAQTLSEPLQSLQVDPVLGHDLPTGATTPSGFPRADFATANADKEKKPSPVDQSTTNIQRRPGVAVIYVTPPRSEAVLMRTPLSATYRRIVVLLGFYQTSPCGIQVNVFSQPPKKKLPTEQTDVRPAPIHRVVGLQQFYHRRLA